jgi:hypothetical protein
MAAAAFSLLLGCAAILTLGLLLLRRLLRRLKDLLRDKAAQDEEAKRCLRGPRALPLLGSLHRLAGPAGPFGAFTAMAREYGEIYEIRLGVSRCVVVSSYRLVKEVLITKGSHFGGRPDFMRFHQLFGGDRNNCKA